MKRAYAKRQDSHKPELAQPPVPIVAAGPEIQLSLDRDELLGLMQDSLESSALKLGMLVASSLVEDEVTRMCGRRHERQPHRTHTRYGHRLGTATLAGQRIAIARPRVRRTGGGEVPLETYARLQSPKAMPQAVLRRMARGVSTRDYANVIDLTRDGFGVTKSNVSRDFVRASAARARGHWLGRPKGFLGPSKLDGKAGETPTLLGRWVSKASIAKILEVAASTLHSFIQSRRLEPRRRRQA